MKKFLIACLLIPLSSVAQTEITGDAIWPILGIGYSGLDSRVTQCVSGVETQTFLSKPTITYNLRKEAYFGQVKLIAEITVVDKVLTFEKISPKKNNMITSENFFNVCGDSYL